MNFFKSKDPDIAEISREKRVKETIITELSICLKNIQATQQARRPGEPIYTSDSSNHLCTILEAVFLHGHKSTQGLRRQNTDNKAFDRCSFWSFVLRFTHKDTIGQLKRLAHVKTETGVCRAWVILAVNDGLMESYLTTILAQPNVLRQFYAKTALLRDIEQPDILIKLIQVLAAANYDFQLVYNSSQLNVWGMKTLALAGLVERQFVSDRGNVVNDSRNSPRSSSTHNHSTSSPLDRPRTSTLDMEDFPHDVFSYDQNSDDVFNGSTSSSDRLSQHTSGSFNKPSQITNAVLDQSLVLPEDSLQQSHPAIATHSNHNAEDMTDCKLAEVQLVDGSKRNSSKATIHDSLQTLGEEDVASAGSKSQSSVGSTSTSRSGDSSRFKVTDVERELARLRTAHYSISDITPDSIPQMDQFMHGTDDTIIKEDTTTPKQSSAEVNAKSHTPPTLSETESFTDNEPMEEAYGSPAILGFHSRFVQKSDDILTNQSKDPEPRGWQAEELVAQSEETVQRDDYLVDLTRSGDQLEGATQHNSYLADLIGQDSQSEKHTRADSQSDELSTRTEIQSEELSTRTESQSEEPISGGMLAKFSVGTPQSHTDYLSSHEQPENESEEDDDEDVYSTAYTQDTTAASRTVVPRTDALVRNNCIHNRHRASVPSVGLLCLGLTNNSLNCYRESGDNFCELAASSRCDESPYSGSYPLSAAQAIMNKRLSGVEASHGNSLVSLTGWGNPEQEETNTPNDVNIIQVQSFADLVSENNRTHEESFGSPIRDYTVTAGAVSTNQENTVTEEDNAEQLSLPPSHGSGTSRTALVDTDNDDDGDYEIIGGINKNECGEVLTNYGKLCVEEGLDLQDYKCVTCSAPVGIIYGAPRVCAYTKKYYCYECHVNEDSYIPAKIVYNWDFAKYKVCKASKDFLTSAESMPLLNVKFLNPRLYEHVPALEAARVLRTQLVYLKRYLFACNPTDAEEFRQKFWPKEYIYEEIHTYSVQDLLLVNTSSTLANQMKKGIKSAKSHVHDCESCEYRGFHCEICRSRQVIFPFDLDTTSRCEKCNGVYHKACLTGDCPKCERIRQRDLLLGKSPEGQGAADYTEQYALPHP